MNRIGIDIGGTKIEIAVLAYDGAIVFRRRAAMPTSYGAVLEAITGLVQAAEAVTGHAASVGVGFPGRVDPANWHVRDGTALNGHAIDRDLAAALGRPVRVANDAVCFALSEATDGAGRGARVVFGVILGTGVGGGVVVDARPILGANGLAGEWGHNRFPFEDPADLPGKACWCGRRGCIETVLSGVALAQACDGPAAHDASTIPARAAAGDPRAQAALRRHTGNFARALAEIVNILDPDVIVLGGGLSNMAHLYKDTPELMRQFQFCRLGRTEIRRAVHGDSSGVRGAAWLWPDD